MEQDRRPQRAVKAVVAVLLSSGVLSALMAASFVRGGVWIVALPLLAWSAGSFWSAWHTYSSRERLIQDALGGPAER